jgi:hypothetical protein
MTKPSTTTQTREANVITDAERVELARAIAESDIAGCSLENEDIDALVDLFEAWLERRAPSTTEQVIRLREALEVIRDYRSTCMICVDDPEDTELDAEYRKGARAVLDNVAVMARAALQPKAETDGEQEK